MPAELPPGSEMAPGGALVLAKAGELSLRAKTTAAFLEKHSKSDVSEEWKKVDDKKIAKLRGILKALQEENHSTQLLKMESKDKEAGRALDCTRAGVELRLQACREREELFVRRQAELRRHVMENEKSLQELEANIEKGEKKSRDEQQECRNLDKEIRAREEELREQEKLKATEQKKIAQMAQYKKFLAAVVQECEEDFEGDIEVLMNRHSTLEAGNQELHQANNGLTERLDKTREECLRVQTQLQNEHLMISSRLHECQVTLEKHRAENQELEQRLNRALEAKEVKEGQVGVIQMAIEQLFTRALSSCRLKQRRIAMLSAVDIKHAPVRGDKSEARQEELLAQIIQRVEDLQDMHNETRNQLGKNTARQENVIDDSDNLEKIRFVQQGEKPRSTQAKDQSGRTDGGGRSSLPEPGEDTPATLSSGNSSMRRP
mmetsp:Transcript_59467/g.159265  ORF Transcript_59467/g.159265 Transcript_59467/m.159265 type:complete len:433 (-) Transcript_59467:108-1406(-)